MKILSLHKFATLVAVLTIGSVSIVNGAFANGGGGVGGEYINGQALATGGDFSCSDPDDPTCLNNDQVNQLPSIRHPNRIAHNHKGAEPSRYRY